MGEGNFAIGPSFSAMQRKIFRRSSKERERDFLRLPRLPRRGAERFGKIQDQTDRLNRLDCRELPVCFFCGAETCLETFERRTARPITGWRELVGSLIVYLWSNYAGKGIENWIPEVSNTENAEAVFGLKIWCGEKKKKKKGKARRSNGPIKW